MDEIGFAYSSVQGDGICDEQNFSSVVKSTVLGSIGRECDVCGFTAESLKQYLEHMNRHIPVCHICNESFRTLNCLMVHKENVHNECTKFKCGKCSQTFKSLTEASTHYTYCRSDTFNRGSCNKILTFQENIAPDLNIIGKDDRRGCNNNILADIESLNFIPRNEKLNSIHNKHGIKTINTSKFYIPNDTNIVFFNNLDIVKVDAGNNLNFIDMVSGSTNQLHNLTSPSNGYPFLNNEVIEKSNDTHIQTSRDISVIVERINSDNNDEETNKTTSCSKKEVLIIQEKNNHQNKSEKQAALKTVSGQETFFCNLCSKGYVSKVTLKRHIKFVHPTKKVACEVCNKLFKSKAALKRHVKNYHVNRKICNICGKPYSNSNHLKTHDDNRPIVATCNICGKGFHNIYSLQTHKETHNEGKPYVCTICNASFKTKPSLFNHCYKRQAPELKCHLCEKRFCIRYQLKIHLKNSHSTDYDMEGNDYQSSVLSLPSRKTFQCNICGKSYVTKPVLLRHIKSVHSMKKVACKVCNKLFKSELSLRFHIAKGHENKKICDICGKTYTNVAIHLKTHNKRIEAMCDICGRGFNSYSAFNFHMEGAHTDERQHICTICKASFKTRISLWNHCNRHREASLECNLCERKFNNKGQLKTHLRTHTGEEPYNCSDCGESFKWTSSLKHHRNKCNKIIRD